MYVKDFSKGLSKTNNEDVSHECILVVWTRTSPHSCNLVLCNEVSKIKLNLKHTIRSKMNLILVIIKYSNNPAFH